MIALLAAALLIVFAVMAERPEEEKRAAAYAVTEEEALAAVPATDSDDMSALTRVFGARLPALKNERVAGQVRNGSFEGKTARLATLRFDSLTVSAVRPASAAPLLKPDGLDVVLADGASVLGMPALLFEGKGAYCLCFSDEAAAYSVYREGGTREEFLLFAASLTSVR